VPPLVPVELRDRLYKLFASAIKGPKPTTTFEKKADAFKLKDAAERVFFDDRLPRYLSTLAGATISPPADRFALELETAELLFNHGLFFDAHEFLETPWKREPEPRKTYVQGLIQIAAAFHKLELDPAGLAGAHYLLARGLDKVGDPALAKALRPALAELTAGRKPDNPPALKFSHHPPRGG
jgi:Domain of unknown function (DUF309)